MNLVDLKKKCFIVAGFLSLGFSLSPLISQSFAQFAPLPPTKDCARADLKETNGLVEGNRVVEASPATQEGVGSIRSDEKGGGSESTVLNSNGKAIRMNFSGSDTSAQIAPGERQ